MHDHDYNSDPWFGIGAHSRFESADGAHLDLKTGDPLYLSNTYLLANRAIGGDDEADEALHHRLTCFHEAGHLWGIMKLSTPNRSLWARTDRVGVTSRPARFVAAMGPLAQATSALVDQCEFTGVMPHIGLHFGGFDISHPSRQELPPRARMRHAETFQHHATVWWNKTCPRGGDAKALRTLESPAWVRSAISPLLRQWWGLDRVARLLMAGVPWMPADLEALMLGGHQR